MSTSELDHFIFYGRNLISADDLSNVRLYDMAMIRAVEICLRERDASLLESICIIQGEAILEN